MRRNRHMRIKPTPVLKTVTYGVYEPACLLLGLDPDEVLEGTARVLDTPLPRGEKATQFIRTVLENGDRYDLDNMAPDVRRYFLGIVRANFLIDSVNSSRVPGPRQILYTLVWAFRNRRANRKKRNRVRRW